MILIIEVTAREEVWDSEEQREEIQIEAENPDTMHSLVDGICTGLRAIIHDTITLREYARDGGEEADEELG